VTRQEGLAPGADEISAAFAGYEANQPRPITCDQASQRYGPGLLAARERYDVLSGRYHLARAYATLRARGEYDPTKHGTGDTEPLTAEEHLELLALGEYLARSYKPSFEVDNALRAGGYLGTGRRGPGHRRGHGAGGLPGLGRRPARHAQVD
jgi:hypothetical protein